MRKSPTPNQNPAIRWLRAGVYGSAAALVLAAGCAQSVGDVDRTQPNLVPKDAFEGQWFVRQSVIEVPATAVASFVGEMASMEVVVWEVQQDHLVGYRAYEKVPGIEAEVEDFSTVNDTEVLDGLGDGRDPNLYKGNPVIAFAISNHVDVQRDYNARTGEQTNVVSENSSDRPWYEREWMRVDWSQNVIDNFLHKPGFVFGESHTKQFIEENEGGSDAFRMEQNEDGEVYYFDFTERHFVAPNIMGCVNNLFRNGIGDCTEDQLKVRTSFLKVDIEREQDYEPVVYDDRRHGEFGFFRTERPTYDRGFGNTFTGLQQLANRYEIWSNNRDEDGNLKDHADRDLRQVTYHLSPNYPQDLVETAEQMAEEYDQTFKEIAAAARGQSIDELTDDVREQFDDSSCLFCLDLNEEGTARIGDLRYNFIYWVDDPQGAGPLGYGPSSAHPETGRIVSSSAYVYGAGVDRYAQTAKDIVDGLNGDLDTEDLIGFQHVKDAVQTGLRGLSNQRVQELQEIQLDSSADLLLLGEDKARRLEMFRELGPEEALPAYAPGWEEQQIGRIQGTEFEPLLIAPEMETTFDPNGYFQHRLGDNLQLIENTTVPSPVHWSTKKSLEALNEVQGLASRNNIWLEDFTDPAIVGLAREMADREITGDDLLQELRVAVYRAVMLHEIGHTVGLRHNFGGSGDALNYQDEYWDLREATLPSNVTAIGEDQSIVPYLRSNCAVVDSINEEACEAQLDGRMAEFQYSSIMDYGSRFNSDIHGLGKWDKAALASAYADLVEVFDDEVSDNLDENLREGIQAANNRLNPVVGRGQGIHNIFGAHYTDIPDILGGVENLKSAKRRFIPRSEWDNESETGPLKVPYMSCYDEFADSVDTCHRWDHGADNYEIVADYIQRYQEYYVFNNFQRDRIGFSGFDTMIRVAQRYMLPITNMYQHWLFGAFGGGGTANSVLGQIATLEGFQMLWDVVTMPNYGAFVLNPDTNELRLASYDHENQEIDADLRIAPGEGRRTFSRYDLDSGYDFFERILESGHYYDQLGALLALTSFDASVVSAGIEADALTYSIPYYLIFNNELNRLFSAGYRRDYYELAPRLIDGELQKVDVFSLISEQSFDADAPRVVTTLPFSIRLQLIFRAMALFKANFDTQFAQKANIAIDGSGDDQTVAPGFEAIETYNPLTGRTYRAWRPEDPARHDEGWLGAELVLELQAQVALWEEASPDDRPSIENGVRRVAEDIETARGFYAVLNNAVF